MVLGTADTHVLPMKVFATGLAFAILGLVFTILVSLIFTVGSCVFVLLGFCWSNSVSFKVNSGTYVGAVVVIFAAASAWADLIRSRARTKYLRDFP
jgi:hypothetical protein